MVFIDYEGEGIGQIKFGCYVTNACVTNYLRHTHE